MKNPRTQVSIPNFVCGSLSAAKRILLQALFGRTGDKAVDRFLFLARGSAIPILVFSSTIPYSIAQDLASGEIATADQLKIRIDTTGYYLDAQGVEKQLYPYFVSRADNPSFNNVEILRAATGDSYLFIEIDEFGSCGTRGVLASLYNQQILHHEFPNCSSWQVVRPSILVTYKLVSGLCGSEQDRASRIGIPLALEVIGYTPGESMVRLVRTEEALEANQLQIAYQQVFDDILRSSSFENIADQDELAFCESLMTDLGISQKFQLLLIARPDLGNEILGDAG